jgi:hypothetical protein
MTTEIFFLRNMAQRICGYTSMDLYTEFVVRIYVTFALIVLLPYERKGNERMSTGRDDNVTVRLRIVPAKVEELCFIFLVLSCIVVRQQCETFQQTELVLKKEVKRERKEHQSHSIFK